MKVKFKKLTENAVTPKYSRAGDGALDMVCTSIEFTDQYIEYGTGIALEIPEGYVGLLFPRSSVSNLEIILANSVGFIDHNFRGEIKFRFKKIYHTGDEMLHTEQCELCEGEGNVRFTDDDCPACNGFGEIEMYSCYEPGDRIGQLFITEREYVEMEEVEELSDTSRGSGGFGSSGK